MQIPVSSDVSLIVKAFNYAAEKHVNQRRKGANAEPYINHPAEVAMMLEKAGAPVHVIVAGILHDIIEDTDLHLTDAEKYDMLKKEFGQRIADIVLEVTDDKSLPKARRKELQIEHAPHASNDAKIVKLADRCANLKSMMTSPPDDWDEKRILEYFIWSKKVVDGCRGVNAILEKNFDAAYKLKMG